MSLKRLVDSATAPLLARAMPFFESPYKVIRDTFATGALAGLILSALTGCTHRTNEMQRDTGKVSGTSGGSTLLVVPITPEHVAFEGRWQHRGSASDGYSTKASWPASALHFRFIGTSIAADIGDVPFPDDTPDTDWLHIDIDGTRQLLHLRNGKRRYDLASGLSRQEHAVSIIKRTESDVGTIELNNVIVRDGKLFGPPPLKSKNLLVIGDSITTGYGIEGTDAQCQGTAANENIIESYAFLAAESLGANITALAWSGKGVYRNARTNDEVLLSSVLNRVLVADPSTASDPKDKADAVVIHLGTNDFSLPSPNKTAFKNAYRNILTWARTRHPAALIVVAYGPMLADDYPPGSFALTKARKWFKSIVGEARSRGDAKIKLLEFALARSSEGYSCDVHPSKTTHKRMAAALADAIKHVF